MPMYQITVRNLPTGTIKHSVRNEIRLRGDVPYFLWHGTRPSYKHLKIWGFIVYIINGRATGNKLDDRSHGSYSI